MKRLNFTDTTDISSPTKIWESVSNKIGVGSIGAFKLKDTKDDFYLYPLDEFDTNFYSDVKMRKNERIYRYETRTSAIGGFCPIIKVNVKSGLVYFQKDMYSEGVEFETISDKPLWIDMNITEKIND